MIKRREFIAGLGRGGVAASGAGSAGGDAGDWLSQQPIDGRRRPDF